MEDAINLFNNNREKDQKAITLRLLHKTREYTQLRKQKSTADKGRVPSAIATTTKEDAMGAKGPSASSMGPSATQTSPSAATMAPGGSLGSPSAPAVTGTVSLPQETPAQKKWKQYVDAVKHYGKLPVPIDVEPKDYTYDKVYNVRFLEKSSWPRSVIDWMGRSGLRADQIIVEVDYRQIVTVYAKSYTDKDPKARGPPTRFATNWTIYPYASQRWERSTYQKAVKSHATTAFFTGRHATEISAIKNFGNGDKTHWPSVNRWLEKFRKDLYHSVPQPHMKGLGANARAVYAICSVLWELAAVRPYPSPGSKFDKSEKAEHDRLSRAWSNEKRRWWILCHTPKKPEGGEDCPITQLAKVIHDNSRKSDSKNLGLQPITDVMSRPEFIENVTVLPWTTTMDHPEATKKTSGPPPDKEFTPEPEVHPPWQHHGTPPGGTPVHRSDYARHAAMEEHLQELHKRFTVLDTSEQFMKARFARKLELRGWDQTPDTYPAPKPDEIEQPEAINTTEGVISKFNRAHPHLVCFEILDEEGNRTTPPDAERSVIVTQWKKLMKTFITKLPTEERKMALMHVPKLFQWDSLIPGFVLAGANSISQAWLQEHGAKFFLPYNAKYIDLAARGKYHVYLWKQMDSDASVEEWVEDAALMNSSIFGYMEVPENAEWSVSQNNKATENIDKKQNHLKAFFYKLAVSKEQGELFLSGGEDVRLFLKWGGITATYRRPIFYEEVDSFITDKESHKANYLSYAESTTLTGAADVLLEQPLSQDNRTLKDRLKDKKWDIKVSVDDDTVYGAVLSTAAVMKPVLRDREAARAKRDKGSLNPEAQTTTAPTVEELELSLAIAPPKQKMARMQKYLHETSEAGVLEGKQKFAQEAQDKAKAKAPPSAVTASEQEEMRNITNTSLLTEQMRGSAASLTEKDTEVTPQTDTSTMETGSGENLDDAMLASDSSETAMIEDVHPSEKGEKSKH